MEILRTVDEFRRYRRSLRGSLALVPTMGALHEGHLSHVAAAREQTDRVAVSIFVNPTQFGPQEDLERYPRPFEEDVARCEAAGVDGIFAPDVDGMYPPDAIEAQVDVPALTDVLEGAFRPDHFAGVCRVVVKLLMIVQPDVMTVGRKDYQQLRVLEATVRDLMIPVRVLEIPTMREPDGLAMSSRNRYLDAEQRRHALGLYKALQQAKLLVEDEGESDPQAVERAMAATLAAHALEIDYAAVRHPKTLLEVDCLEPDLTGGVAALIAARLGGVRLIDNMLLGTQSS